MNTLFENTSQLLTVQLEKFTDTPLPAEAVDDQLLHAIADSREGDHIQPDLDQSSPGEATAEVDQLQTIEDTAGAGPDDDDTEQISLEDENGEQKDTQQDNSPGSTFSERLVAGKHTCQQLEQLTTSLITLCRESDPHFVLVGRDLTIVTRDVKKLTDSVHRAVSLLQNEQEGEASLKKTEALVQDVFKTLSEERKVIDRDVVQVKNLVSQIFQCARIKEMIGRINTLFRIVRINIKIQCSVQSLSDEMFEEVTEDLDYLSKRLYQVTKQILSDINLGAKSLTSLQKLVTEHVKQVDQVLQQANTIVSKAFYDIRQLMRGTETMIREADSISKKVSDRVGEVVVSIQFHDSLSQRAEHTIHAFEDIGELCGNDEITEEHLGTAFIILDLQLRQLVQISKEIKLVRERIESDFLAIESEVEGLGSILQDTRFQAIGPQQFLSALFSSLEDTLMNLNSLLAEGEDMAQHIEETAGETRTIVNNLIELKENVSEIREETRIQAVNTIIMASTLGQKGKTIEVLAKEIQTLSDNSSVLADDVKDMYLVVRQSVEGIIASTTKKKNHIDRDNLVEEIRSIKNSFSEIIDVVTDMTQQIEISGSHIQTTRSALIFLDTLESDLDFIVQGLSRTRDKLAPWEGKGTHDSEEIEQLIKRYSMAQERMIHMFDPVGVAQDAGVEDDVLF